jgi:eukaryotic-like serine/threonine-protein kinase
MHDLLSGLHHMHTRGVLYRDIKPSNVLWNDDENRATYIDYDVATFFDAEALHRSIVGTDGYMVCNNTTLPMQRNAIYCKQYPNE